MTVAELIKELSEYPSDSLVFTSEFVEDHHGDDTYLIVPTVSEIDVVEDEDGSIEIHFYGDPRSITGTAVMIS